MTIDYTTITVKELVEKVKSKEINSCTYSTMKEFYEGLRQHAINPS